jgi:very-short-patch-repair endonuclease
LCDALIKHGFPVAPLAVFLKGDGTYSRIENDFTLLIKGRVCVIEVDGPQHLETPVAAQNRVESLLANGVEVRRVSWTDCNTAEKAAACAVNSIEFFKKRLSI